MGLAKVGKDKARPRFNSLQVECCDVSRYRTGVNEPLNLGERQIAAQVFEQHSGMENENRKRGFTK
jgi:hypothetical protein